MSKITKSYYFKDNTDMFKLYNSDLGLHAKISESLKNGGEKSKVRFINDWMLSINGSSMFIWKYDNLQKNVISSCSQYFLPNSDLLYSPNQAIIINDPKDTRLFSCLVVGDDAVVRFWPDLSITDEYIDQKIPNVYNDPCLLAEKVSDDVLVFVFNSMKLVIADLKDYTDAGISFKQFVQPTGFINGFTRCLSSLFIGSNNQFSSFIALRSNRSLIEDYELLILNQNNIDSLTLDVLHNGKYTKAILSEVTIRKAISRAVSQFSDVEPENLLIELRNFDLCRNIVYIIVRVKSQIDNRAESWVLVTYNKLQEIVDSVATVTNELHGDIEISVIDNELQESDDPCLLVAIRDDRAVIIVEVLTGTVKATLDASQSSQVVAAVNPRHAIIGWTCPRLPHDASTIVVALTTTKQLLYIKQKINPFFNELPSFRTLADSRLWADNDGDISFSRIVGRDGDTAPLNNKFINKLRPMALSTPKSKADQRGDVTFSDKRGLSVTGSRVDPNASQCEPGALDSMCGEEQGAFGQFKRAVVLFWLGYKSQASRVMSALVEMAQVNADVVIPVFVLQVAREILDELPLQDPRWTRPNNRSSSKFCYSNKSLLLGQQLAAKRDALQTLLVMLEEYRYPVMGPLGTLAPLSASRCLFSMTTRPNESVPLFGDCQVSWSVANCVGMCGELIEFVRILNEILSSTECPEISSILARSCQEVLRNHKKITPLEVISQHISLVPTFISDCCNFLNEKREGLTDPNNFQGNLSDHVLNVNRICQLLARILSACLRASVSYRKQFETTFLPSHFSARYTSPSTVSACWITENKSLGVSDSIIDLIFNLVDFSRSLDNSPLMEQVFDIVTVYLDCFRHRIDWMDTYSTNSGESERLLKTYIEVRQQLIRKLVEDGRFVKKGLELADQFQDFFWIVELCELLDSDCQGGQQLHLDPFLRKYDADGFSEFVLNWYQSKLKEGRAEHHSRLLAKIQLILENIQRLEAPNNSASRMETSCSSSAAIDRFLSSTEARATRWLHEIETNDFGQAAASLLHLGEAERDLLGRQKSLLSLAKLSRLAQDEGELGDDAANEVLSATGARLHLIKFLEDVPPATLQAELGYSCQGPRSYPVIGEGQLVKLLVASGAGDESGVVRVHYLVRALELLDFCLDRQARTGQSQENISALLSAFWGQILLMDRWAAGTERDTRATVLHKVLADAFQRGLNLARLLPDTERIFEQGAEANEELRDIAADADAIYRIRHTLETILADLQLVPAPVATHPVSMDIDCESVA